MKILHVITTFHPTIGGAEAYVLNLSKELVIRGHQVTVLTSELKGSPKEETIDGIRVMRKPIFSMILMLLKQRFDVVHVHQYRRPRSGLAYALVGIKGTPLVITLHGIYPSYSLIHRISQEIYDAFFGAIGLARARAIISLTEVEKKQLIDLGCDPTKITVIPNAISFEEFEVLPSPNKFKKKHGISDNMILYVGRLDWNKGLECLVKAMPTILEKTNAKLVLVGKIADDAYGEKINMTVRLLRELIRDLNMEDCVILTGLIPREDLISAYVDAEALILPSKYEGLPTAVLEALASETPVIVADTWGTQGVVVHGKTGFVVKYGDVSELAHETTRLLLDEKSSQTMGRNGRESVRAGYTWDTIAGKIEKIYESVSVARAKMKRNCALCLGSC